MTHIAARDSLTLLMAYAAATENIKLGTGVLPIYSRTPVATAQQAATIDEYSKGRMVLGLGVSHAVTVENWYGTKIERPVDAMREYVGAVRAMLHGRRLPAGRASSPRTSASWAISRAPTCRSTSPRCRRTCCELAGEVADGAMLWLCNPDYIRDVVVPEVQAGRERAGKSMDGFDIVAAVPSAVTDDRAAAYETMRNDLVTYWSLPVLPRDDRALRLRRRHRRVRRRHAGRATSRPPSAAISDEFLDASPRSARPRMCARVCERYRDAGATSPCVGAVPRTDFEATLEAAAA